MNEMMHTVRVIPLDGRPAPAETGVRQYVGDSRGHWDGDTLVVETVNFNDDRTHITWRNILLEAGTGRWWSVSPASTPRRCSTSSR